MNKINLISRIVVFALVLSILPIRFVDFQFEAFDSVAYADVTDATYGVTDYVYFADPNLESAIKQELNYSDVYLTQGVLQNLNYLHIINKNVTSLNGLEHATNLTGIDFIGGSSSGLNKLINMPSVRGLIFQDNMLQDFTTLRDMPQLKTLRLTNVPNIDLQTVSQNTYVQELQIGQTTLSDTFPIYQMTGLRALSFYQTEISDATPICSLTNLSELVVSQSHVQDISCMSSLINLESVNVSYNNISDISPLTSLPRIQSIIANNNNVATIPTVASPSPSISSRTMSLLSSTPSNNIQVLDLSANNITDIRPLESMPNLVNIALDNNRIQDISTFQAKAGMTNLSINGNDITNIRPLNADTNDHMIYLGLKRNRIRISNYQDVIQSFQAKGTNVEYSEQRVSSDTSSGQSEPSATSPPPTRTDVVKIEGDTASFTPSIVTKTVNNQVVDTISLDPEKIKSKTNDKSISSLDIKADGANNSLIVNIPQAIKAIFKDGNGVINISSGSVVYAIPTELLKDDADIHINLLNAQRQQELENMSHIKFDSLYDFDITFTDGSKYSLDNTLITRMIKLKSEKDLIRIVNVSETGEIEFIPFQIRKINDDYYAVFKRNSNSLYGVIKTQNNDTINTDHWVKPYVDQIQTKLGLFNQNINFDRKTTREEFVHYLVKSLGLSSKSESNVVFNDSKSSPYYPDLIIAAKLQLINGDGNGNFNPHQNITREQVAVVTSKALKLFSNHLYEQGTGRYLDEFLISKWARASIKLVEDNSILYGDTNNRFKPQGNITQAESIVVVYNLLKHLDMI